MIFRGLPHKSVRIQHPPPSMGGDGGGITEFRKKSIHLNYSFLLIKYDGISSEDRVSFSLFASILESSPSILTLNISLSCIMTTELFVNCSLFIFKFSAFLLE